MIHDEKTSIIAGMCFPLSLLRFIFHVKINVPVICLKLLGCLMLFEEMYIFYHFRIFMLFFLALITKQRVVLMLI